MDWILHDEEMFTYVTGHFARIDTALYGRTTYEMMESYWPTIPSNPASTPSERHHAAWVEEINKIVFSTTLPGVEWNNTRLISNNFVEEVKKLQQQPGKDLMIFGSPRLTHSFLQHGLIDEFLINVNPKILGKGIPLFNKVKEDTNLTLISSTTFKPGVVGLHYETKRK